MKVIFIQNLKNVAQKGEVKEVADGYARNYLFPKKIAEAATPEIIGQVEKDQENKKAQENDKKEGLKKIAQSIQGKTFVIKSKSEQGKLFGSINIKEITGKLKDEGFEMEEDWILIKNPIKEIGEREIDFRLPFGITGNFILKIEED